MSRNRRLPIPGTLAVLVLFALSLGSGGCGGQDRSPVVVIGFDGAEFDLLVPWIEAGELPHLKALIDRSAVGELHTVYPILSPVCWTSAHTGVNPGKHGIYDFQKPDPDGGPLLIEQATSRRATPVWTLLSEARYRVGVLNVPMTYPPDPVRGYMVSGFPFPSGDVNITYPPELHEALGDYPLDHLDLKMEKRTAELMYSDFRKRQDVRARVALDWLRSDDFDFLWLVFTGPDKAQHFFWRHMDSSHPNHDPRDTSGLGTAILDLWKRQDEILGEMLATLPEDATVMILSDHGFDSITRRANMANWIPRTEFTEWMQNHATPPLTITNGLLHYILEGDLPGTADREAAVDLFMELCWTMRDPKTGKVPFENIFRREEIYHGRMLDKAPDIVFQEIPHYYVTPGHVDSVGQPLPDMPVFEDLHGISFSGHHRPEGILLMAGPEVQLRTRGTLRERLAAGGDYDRAGIMDVAPTLLALFGQPIPDQMDGRVLEEALAPEFLSSFPVNITEVRGFLLDQPPPSRLSKEDKERMKALPYLQ